MRPTAFRVTSRTFVLAAVLLLIGGCLLAVGWILRPVTDAEQAVRDRRLVPALEGYIVAEKRLTSIPLARRVVPRVFEHLVDNELSLMYELKRYDDVIDKASIAGTASGSFWSGCALFSKADAEFLLPDKRATWFGQALEQFKRAVGASPADFDAKFNYELTRRVITILEDQPNDDEEKPKALKLLKPTAGQAVKKVG